MDVFKKGYDNVLQRVKGNVLRNTYEREQEINIKLDEANQDLKLLQGLDKFNKKFHFDTYLKKLMIDYLRKIKDIENFKIVTDINEKINVLNTDYTNSILIGIPVNLINTQGGNVEFSDKENFNYIITNDDNFNEIFLNKYSGIYLDSYIKNNTIKNYEKIIELLSTREKQILNIEDNDISFNDTNLFENLIGGNSIFSGVGSYDNNSETYVYFRINFESSFDCNENFDNMQYINFILEKYNLTSQDIDNKINKNKELILIEQNKYNIKMEIFRILKYISIILVILLIFVIGYYYIGINNLINKTLNKNSNKKINNNTNNNTNNSMVFKKKNNV